MTPAQFGSMSDVVSNERKLQDTQLGWLRLILAEPNRDKKKRSKPFEIDDFRIFSEKKSDSGNNNSGEEMDWKAQKLYVTNFLHPFFSARAKLEQQKRKG